MITKLLDDLEVFLNVGVMSLNSSNLEMPGGTYIYIYATKSIEPFVAVGPFLCRAPVRPVVGHRCNWSLTALNYPLAF